MMRTVTMADFLQFIPVDHTSNADHYQDCIDTVLSEGVGTKLYISVRCVHLRVN